MEKTKKISMVIAAIFVIPVLFIATASMAVTVTVESSGGSSVSTTYYTQDGDHASGDANLVNGTVNVTTSGSVERGLIRTQGGDGSRDFCPFTGAFEAGGTATGNSASTTSSCTGTPRVNIFIVTQNPDHAQNCCAANFYDKIQDGVDDAPGAGDSWVLVDEGTYKGAVIGNKNTLSLESVWGAADTTIDGREGGTTLYAYNSKHLSIDGFTITGGTGFGSDPGYGLDVSNCDEATIKNNTITGNHSHGIYVLWSNYATIQNNTVTDNVDDGIYVHDSNDATIQNNTVAGCTIGILVTEGSDNATIENNTVAGNGVGIRVRLSNDAEIKNNTVTGNGYGIAVPGGDRNTIENNSVTDNEDDGIYVAHSTDATIQNNTVTGNKKNGISVSLCNDATIQNNIVADNENSGISVTLFSDRVTIQNNTVADNHAGIHLSSGTTGVRINQNNIYGNEKYGLWNSTLNTVNAENNWWGGHAPPSYEGSLGVGVQGTPGIDIWDAGNNLVDYTPWAPNPY